MIKPIDLDDRASELWDGVVATLTRMDLLDSADQVEVEMLCRIYSEWRDSLDIVEKDGRICESFDDKGQLVLKTHPAVRQASDASKRLKSILSDFGMNPSSRVQFGDSKKSSNPFTDLINN